LRFWAPIGGAQIYYFQFLFDGFSLEPETGIAEDLDVVNGMFLKVEMLFTELRRLGCLWIG